MACEAKRGCGFRHVGGLYLCGEFTPAPCDRMPFPLTVCPVCGYGIKLGLGFTKVNPYRLWGPHQGCEDIFPLLCLLCDPKDETALIMRVGKRYYKTPQEFLDEATRMGISKRLPSDQLPKDLKLGKTVLYLAHPKACEVREPAALQEAMAIVEESQTKQPRLLETEKVTKALGIFCAFIPQKVEKLIWEKNATPEGLESLEKRGITPVIVPDGDKDHA